MGSLVAAVIEKLYLVAKLLPIGPIVQFFASRQVRRAARGTEADNLVAGLVRHVYNPKVTPGDENFMRHINIRAVIGDKDKIVTESSAAAVFHTPPPWPVSGTHTSLKLPANHSDMRYKALQIDMQEALRPSFVASCVTCLSGDRKEQSQFFQAWGRALQKRFTRAFPKVTYTKRAKLDFAAIVWKFGRSNTPDLPGTIINKAVTFFREFGFSDAGS